MIASDFGPSGPAIITKIGGSADSSASRSFRSTRRVRESSMRAEVAR